MRSHPAVTYEASDIIISSALGFVDMGRRGRSSRTLRSSFTKAKSSRPLSAMPTVNGLEFERTANGLVPVSKVTMRGSHVVEPRPRSHRFPHCPPTTADGYPGVDPALDEKRYTAIMEEHQGNRNIVIKHLLEMNEKELENMDASKRKVEPSPTLSRAKSVRRRLSRIFRK